MKSTFYGSVILRLWIPGMIHHLLDVALVKADLHPAKTGSNPWTPTIFFANPYVVRYPLANQNASANSLKTKSPQGRAFSDSYLNGFDYSNYQDIRQNKAVPVNPSVPSSNTQTGATRPDSSNSVLAASYPLVSQQYQASYPYPTGVGYYYPSPTYLPPIQYLPPSQSFNTFDNGGLYTTPNSTIGTVGNTRNQFVIQPHMCSNSIQVIRTTDVEMLTSYRTSNQSYICIIMLYGLSEFNKLAVSVEPRQIQQPTSNGNSTDSWLQTNVKMYSLQGPNITLIDNK